jgi:hypothetical protein
MTVDNSSLWPTDFGEPVLLTPLAILRQQGAALGVQTSNIVVGRVDTRGDGDGFMQLFSVYCAPLDYQIALVIVRHGIDLYPATVSTASIGSEFSTQTAADPEQLRAVLRDIFALPKTKKIIASLLAQSRQ